MSTLANDTNRRAEAVQIQYHSIHYSQPAGGIPLPSSQIDRDGTQHLASTVVTGDVIEVLRGLPAGLVQTVVTSPPYWSLRDYAIPGQIGLEDDPDHYVATLVGVFAEVYRVLSDTGTLWLNIGDSYTSGGRTWRAPDKKNPARAMSTRPPTPPGLKPKELVGIPWRLAFALQRAGWYVRSEIIWRKPNCLSGGAIVYARTQKGEAPIMIKDLVRLDPCTVQLWTGERWSQVTRWIENPQPGEPLEITLRNGQRIGCTPDHLWPTQRGNVRADKLLVGDVIQICQLPEPVNPVRPAFIPDDIGWLIGLYLAEGSRSGNAIQISGHVNEIARFERLQTIAAAYGGTCRMYKTDENGATINLHGSILHAIIDTYIGGHNAKDKHLKPACWLRSNAFLDAVLSGYLAGDGSYDAPNDRWRIGFTRNYALESDLRTLAARLGYSLRLNLAIATFDGREFPTFRGELRKKRSAHHNSKHDGEIMRIEGSRARCFWDISIADEPHLFALASGVLTHNCIPESVKDRPTRSHEYLFLLTKAERYYYDPLAVREANDRQVRSVWDINTEALQNVHFATFPTRLVDPCIRLGSRPGDIVLDPFFGSGTVGVVALDLGRPFLGIDINPTYVDIARRRLDQMGGRLDRRVEHIESAIV